MSTDAFRDQVLDDPEEVERREIHSALQDVEGISDYEIEGSFSPEAVGDAQQRVDVLLALMDRVCALSPLDLGLARHVLRRCRRYEIRAIIPQLLDNFDHFVPVMNDVVLYLRAVANRGMVERNHAAVLRAISSAAVLDVEWARYWAANLVVRTWPLLFRADFERYVVDHGDLESQALPRFKSGMWHGYVSSGLGSTRLVVGREDRSCAPDLH